MQEAAIRDLESGRTANNLSHGDMQKQIVAMNKDLCRVQNIVIKKLKEIVDKHSDTLVGADKELGALQRRIKTLETRFSTHILLTSGLYSAHSPIEPPHGCECMTANSDTSQHENNDAKEALSTLAKFCSARVCSICPLCGDKPVASKCKLATIIPCAYTRIELEEENK